VLKRTQVARFGWLEAVRWRWRQNASVTSASDVVH
jgi:hypothetical protein